ncbi:TPA: hypothetical protein RYX73_004381 [Serratia marcescens]|nr:hypothetical protein [Serratia marcescens]
MKLRNCLMAACAALFLSAGLAHAETKAFGITLSKSKGSDVQALYDGTKIDSNDSIWGGKIYNIPSEDVEFGGLVSLLVGTDSDDVVVAIISSVRKSKIDFIMSQLNEKYHLKKKVLPYVGNKYAEYANDGDVIILDAPHMSFEADLSYLTNNARKVMVDIQKKRSDNKKRQDASQL